MCRNTSTTSCFNFYVGHLDWGDNKNWYAIRRRAPGEGFQYFSWDGETLLFDPNFNRVTSTDTASGLHTNSRATRSIASISPIACTNTFSTTAH